MNNNNKSLAKLRVDVGNNFPELLKAIETIVDNRLSYVASDMADLSSYLRIQASRIKPYREIK
jgi:hypothetical protein